MRKNPATGAADVIEAGVVTGAVNIVVGHVGGMVVILVLWWAGCVVDGATLGGIGGGGK